MPTPSSTPYQLRMFDKSLKKRQKVDLLCRHLGDVAGLDCLLVSCGDNNGAMNYKFREHGGKWTWADAEPGLKAEMETILGEEVLAVNPGKLPFETASFDVVVTIDVHEHLKNPDPFTDELRRVVRPGGRVIATVPNGNSRKLACRIKSLLGMTPEFYGHERWGYDIEELSEMLAGAGLKPVATSSYARFFTEVVELAINFAYVKVLKKGSEDGDNHDHAIAPGSEEDLRGVEKSFRMYSMAYPVLKILSMLDLLVFYTRGYAIVVEATAPAASASGSSDG